MAHHQLCLDLLDSFESNADCDHQGSTADGDGDDAGRSAEDQREDSDDSSADAE